MTKFLEFIFDTYRSDENKTNKAEMLVVEEMTASGCDQSLAKPEDPCQWIRSDDDRSQLIGKCFLVDNLIKTTIGGGDDFALGWNPQKSGQEIST